MKILGSRIHLDMEYVGYTDSSYIYGEAKVNGRRIKRLVSFSVNNCKASSNPWSKNVNITLF
jgi:hypothetical protein